MLFYKYLRDPVSGLTHLAGALLGLFGTIHLMSYDYESLSVSVALLVYGLSLIFLYSASSAYHLLKVGDAMRLKLRRLDHAMVPVFIAGSYTPFCMIALRDSLAGPVILVVVWGLTLAGLVKSLIWIHSPRWVTAAIYLAMGWIVIFAVYPLSQAIDALALWLLVAGGLLYSVGAVIYARKWPDPWPPVFGFHEVWHVFVLAGSACHYMAVPQLVR